MNNRRSKKSEEILLKSVIDTINDGVTIISKDFKVLYTNESIKKKFGDIKGQACFAAYRGRNEPCADCLIFDVFKDGKQRKILRDTILPNGEIRWMECAAGALKDESGEIFGAVEIVRDVTDNMRLSNENTTLKREMERRTLFENIITQSKKIKTIFSLIEKVAPTNSSVLLTGESGTGKELFARAIHQNSKRKDKPFISVNCGSIPVNLIESELFGHVKGSFTGAIRNHRGLIAEANGGTLFLDEIGELPLQLQVKILRFLQEGTCRRIGDTQTQQFDVRIISATNKNLEEAVNDKVFREDLYFRLNVIPIYLPPLRERKEDIAPLANHILQNLCDSHARNISGISPQTLKQLADYNWPGNIRELQNVIEYAIHLAEDEQLIEDKHLPPSFSKIDADEESELPILSIEEFTKKSILSLQKNHNEEEIAEKLGISRKNLWEKRKRWDIQKPIKIN